MEDIVEMTSYSPPRTLKFNNSDKQRHHLEAINAELGSHYSQETVKVTV